MAAGKSQLANLLLYTFIFLLLLSAALGGFFYMGCKPDAFGDYKYAVCQPVKDALT